MILAPDISKLTKKIQTSEAYKENRQEKTTPQQETKTSRNL